MTPRQLGTLGELRILDSQRPQPAKVILKRQPQPVLERGTSANRVVLGTLSACVRHVTVVWSSPPKRKAKRVESRGVNEQKGRYRATLHHKGQTHRLGSFADERSAAKAQAGQAGRFVGQAAVQIWTSPLKVMLALPRLTLSIVVVTSAVWTWASS